jgi:hypothetical protein
MAFGELNLNYDSATSGLFFKNSNGDVVKVGPCQVSATAPNSSPAGSAGNSAGEFWFDSSSNTLKVYDGTAWVESGGDVTSLSAVAPIAVNNTDPLNPIVSIGSATTSVSGAVQLNDTTASTSTTEALTANQGRNLQQQIDALVVSSNLTLAGTLNATTGNLVTVTTEGTAQGFVIGSPLPSPAAGNAEFFVIATVGATSYTPPGGSATEVHVGDWFLSNGTVWNFLDVGFQATYATTATPGIVQLATDAEVQAGTEATHAVTSSGLQSKLSDSVSTTSSATIASSTAVKEAYDAGVQGQTDAATALSAANAAQGDATQALSDAAAAQGDATQALSDASAAQATADAALPKAGGTMTGNITFQDAGEGVIFSGGSSLVGISDATGNTNSDIAASSTAVKTAYDAAIAAASAGDVSGIASSTVIFVNSTGGNNSTGQRGTTKAFLTITAALAVALNGDTIFLSPGTFTENVTLTKGVNMVGTYNEQGLTEGTSILGNFVFDMVNPVATVNPTLNHIRFISPNTSNAFKVLNNSFGAGGIATINDCAFTQSGDSSITEFAFETTGTWTHSMYVRRATFDGNVKHAAGTASGASGGYLVLDDILSTGSALRHYDISTGTVEFRRPSNSISPVLQTGGAVLFTDCISGISPSNATTSPIFGGTNICYKGSAASVGTGTVYFSGWAPITGVINIGANMIYGWSALNVTPANLIISGSALAYTTAVPAAAAVVTASQQRPRFDLLTATSSVAAANQLATVIDSANGTLYTVSALDAGTF